MIHWVLVQIGTMAVYIYKTTIVFCRETSLWLFDTRVGSPGAGLWILDILALAFHRGFQLDGVKWRNPENQFSSFGVDFRSFSYYEYWKIVIFLWLVLGSVVGLESEIDPKKRICYFVFYSFDPIPSCCCFLFVFFDGKLNTWSFVGRSARTSEIRINEPR